MKPAHAKRVWSGLERDVHPVLGNLLPTEITPPIVLGIIKKIEKRGALDISRRAKQCLGQVFQFAIASGLSELDPTGNLGGGSEAQAGREAHGEGPDQPLAGAFTHQFEGYKDEASRRLDVTKSALYFAFLT